MSESESIDWFKLGVFMLKATKGKRNLVAEFGVRTERLSRPDRMEFDRGWRQAPLVNIPQPDDEKEFGFGNVDNYVYVMHCPSLGRPFAKFGISINPLQRVRDVGFFTRKVKDKYGREVTERLKFEIVKVWNFRQHARLVESELIRVFAGVREKTGGRSFCREWLRIDPFVVVGLIDEVWNERVKLPFGPEVSEMLYRIPGHNSVPPVRRLVGPLPPIPEDNFL